MTGPDAPEDVEQTLALAAAALGEGLMAPEPLGGSARSLVLRCRRAGGGSVVVKRFGTGDEGRDGFARERTGLETLGPVPDLLAVDEGRSLLVMGDLGEAETLADVLLGPDPRAAEDAAVGWAAALGGLLGGSRHRVTQAEARLAAAGARPWDPGEALRAGSERLGELVGGEGDPDELDEDLAVILAELRGDQGPRVVSPGDTCPDNAMRTSEGWRFLDLEGTTVHHPALDAAYTVLPFATCWCVFEPPPELTASMLGAYSGSLGAAFPDLVEGPGWTRAVDLACGAWVIASTGWLASGAVAGRPHVGPAGRPAPSFRALLAARWRWGAERLGPSLPATATALGRAAAWASGEWGHEAAELPTYPAFRG